MGRLSGLKDFNNADIVNNVTYGPAGQLLTLSWMNYTETRQYNNLLQRTRLTAAGGSQGSLDLEHKFSSNQNNGRITAMKDWVTGEEVQYTYDALQRLTRAETIGPEWGATYGYDGFGNLLQKTPVKGAGVPLLNIAVDPWTNRVSGLSGGSYDANGGWTGTNWWPRRPAPCVTATTRLPVIGGAKRHGQLP